MTDRRRFIGVLAGGLVALPVNTNAQRPANVARIGFLGSTTPPPELLAAVRGGLRERGYVEGASLALELRWAEGSFDALPALANELASSRVDLMLAWATPAALAAKRATTSIPIVFFAVSDPIGSGLVASLARPGGNVTGVTNIAKDLTARQVQLLAQIAPGLRRVAIMGNPTNFSTDAQQAEAEAAARALGITPRAISVRDPDRIVMALAEAAGQGADGLVVLPDPTFLTRRREIADVALERRLPSIYARREAVQAGGLVAYGASLSDQIRHATAYADRILKGARPAELPVEQPTKLELVINLKTAKALGLTIPQVLLLQADEIIQ
jgi:putative tryptophan/tyrosine transport system substrate-binding protein